MRGLGQDVQFIAAEPPPLPQVITTPTGEVVALEESFFSRKYVGIPVYAWLIGLAVAVAATRILKKHKRSKRR